MSENQEKVNETSQEQRKQPERPHTAFLAAHDNFFQDLNSTCQDMQRRIMDMNFEYQRMMMQAFQASPLRPQDTNLKYQQEMQNLSADTEPTRRINDAYNKYKDALRSAMAGADLEALDPVTLAAIGQSMEIVAQIVSAAQMSQVFWPPQAAASDREADPWG